MSKKNTSGGNSGEAPNPAPESWQAAIISWVWKSKHRDRIVLAAVSVLPLVVAWSVITTDIAETTLLGRIIKRANSDPQPTIFKRNENNPLNFRVLERTDYVDLDTFREVPDGLKNYNISPTLRETRLRLKKTSPNLVSFFNHSKTTGSEQNVACLSGQTFTVQRIEPNAERGEQIHDEFELAINLAPVATGSEVDLRWQTVGWNKYQGENNWWTSTVAGYEIGSLTLIVDFPKDAGVNPNFIVLKYRRKPNVAWISMPDLEKSNLTFEELSGKVIWNISKVEVGTEYAMFWTKALSSQQIH